MFCPQCGAKQTDELRFCKLCGANLHAVRQAVATRETDEEKFDWSKTWVAEMFLSESERKKRGLELAQQCGETPEVKRYNEIKAGVITSCVGVGASIFLYFFMQGVILSGQNPPGENEILSRIWLAGIVPFLIGLGLICNGLFVSTKIVQAYERESSAKTKPTPLGGTKQGAGQNALGSGDTTEFVTPNFSVTEDTTKHLNVSRPKGEHTP